MKEKEGVLFSAEEMNSIEKGNLWNQQQGPVKCLGMEFESDEARRAYFREELRKKLPELRKIEGFPIGEDEDIINLSDPPYYTACPNPWLNDFIAEWEEGKKQLEAEGKRKADFEVKEPYASDVSEGKNSAIYMAHAYHTKCPHPAIMRYILHYTQPGDVVFDGFAGTGMTGVAAATCESKSFVESLKESNVQYGERHCICSDLSPFASNIAFNYNTPADFDGISQELRKIYNELVDEYQWMFETQVEGRHAIINNVVWSNECICSSCGNSFVYWDAALNRENKCLDDEFHCPNCGSIQSKKTSQKCFSSIYDDILDKTISVSTSKPVLIVCTTDDKKRHEKVPSKYDYQVLERIRNFPLNHWVPLFELPDGYNTNQPKHTDNVNFVHQFFTRRNLIILSAFYDKIKNSKYSHKLRFVFTSMIERSTIRNRFSPRNYFYGGGGWCLTGLNGTLYIPYIPMEVSVFEQLKGKLNFYEKLKGSLPSKYSNLVSVQSATCLNMNDNSIDYIFVDPPFGANIMYSELNTIPEGWLAVYTDNKKEAIVNDVQEKTLFEYQSLMNQSFKEFYRVLKPGKWMTIEFSNTSASVWNSIQNSLQGVGFIVANVAGLDKKQGSFKAVTTTTAVKQDLVITCYKPSDELTDKIALSNSTKESVWDFLDEHLAHLPVHIERGNATTTVVERSPKILYDRLISYYVQHGYQIPMDAQEFQAGLHEHFIERDGMFFTAPQASEYVEKRKHTTDFIPMGLIVSDEANGIEWLKMLLKEPKTYQEISPEWMQAVNGLRKGDVLPELKDILEENFIEDETGHWHVPDLEKQIDLEKLKHKSLMKEFNLYKEMAQKPRAHIKEVRVEALREGFKQCFKDKDFATILLVGDKIPQNILTEDEQLLQYYDIAQMRA